MKTNTLLLCIGISGFILLNACQLDPCSSKRFFIYNHDKIIESVKERAGEFTEDDWVRKEAKMDQMAHDCYPAFAAEMTNEEKKNFWMDYLHFNIKRHGRNFFRELEKDAETWPDDMADDLGVVLENPENDIKKFMKEVYGEDIENTIDELITGFEKIGEQIKDWLNKVD
jgi:hypothetical protein